MSDFRDRPLAGPGAELQLTLVADAVSHEEILADANVPAVEAVPARAPPGGSRLRRGRADCRLGRDTGDVDAVHGDLPLAKDYVTVSPTRRASAVHHAFDRTSIVRERLDGGRTRGQ